MAVSLFMVKYSWPVDQGKILSICRFMVARCPVTVKPFVSLCHDEFLFEFYFVICNRTWFLFSFMAFLCKVCIHVHILDFVRFFFNDLT